MLTRMGCVVTDHSVNRIDDAIDIVAPNFILAADNFVCPARAKIHQYLSQHQILDDNGNVNSTVTRGGGVESATVGRMPNRQLIVYDKRQAVIDLGQPYWFDAWGVERDDITARVWRVEIRAGRDALAKQLLRRQFRAVEAYLKDFLIAALEDIRYVVDKGRTNNVSRTTVHPIWDVARQSIEEISAVLVEDRAPLDEAWVLALLRIKRCDMAKLQAFGNLINALVLEGLTPEDIMKNFEREAARVAENYVQGLGRELLRRKCCEVAERLSPLLQASLTLTESSTS